MPDAVVATSSPLLACTRAARRYSLLMFRLTSQERRVLAFILAAFLAGLGIKHWRGMQAVATAAAEAKSF